MIEKLNILEHIRKRPGMYIGALNHYGYQELLSYLIEDFIKFWYL
ncbi:DNA gyrase/topoisomerase IV subunit B [Chryseobacterium sp. W4I1]|nr:DNA gyrase/topoisomerase IV subunit B [Chryseobacterium sp. W4I1]